MKSLSLVVIGLLSCALNTWSMDEDSDDHWSPFYFQVEGVSTIGRNFTAIGASAECGFDLYILETGFGTCLFSDLNGDLGAIVYFDVAAILLDRKTQLYGRWGINTNPTGLIDGFRFGVGLGHREGNVIFRSGLLLGPFEYFARLELAVGIRINP